MTLILDITRSLQRAARLQAPTGIDRVEVTYLNAALACTARPVHFVALGRRGWRWIPAARVRRLIAEPPARLVDPAAPIDQLIRASRPRRGLLAALRRWAREALYVVEDSLAPATADFARHGGAVFLKASHDRLDREPAFAALAGLRIVIFVHDVQPFEVPQFFTPDEFERHHARMHTVARYADEVLVNSRDTAARFLAACRNFGWREPSCTVLPLGVPPTLDRSVNRPASPGSHFVMLGTVQPRKNHVLMLQLWCELAERGGAVPTLVIIGRRGWLSDPVFRMLRRSPVLGRHVVFAGPLDDAEAWAVLGRARALLMPSHAEGYALPIAEALALGVPVLASDLPAHREVGGDRVTYLDPIDGLAWLAAIARRADEDGPAAAGHGTAYRPPTWAEHLAGLRRVLDPPTRSEEAKT